MSLTPELGVLMTSELDLDSRILQLTKSALILVNLIFRCFIIKEPDVYIRLYKSLVLSKIPYCSPVWESHLTLCTKQTLETVKLEMLSAKERVKFTSH